MAQGARVKVIMACQSCSNRNYHLTKNKKIHPERMELKKYCRVCKSHTQHKETR